MNASQRKYAIERIAAIALDRMSKISENDRKLVQRYDGLSKITLCDLENAPRLPVAEEDKLNSATLAKLFDLSVANASRDARVAEFTKDAGEISQYTQRIALRTNSIKEVGACHLRFPVSMKEMEKLQKHLFKTIDAIMFADDDEAQAIINSF